MSRAPAAKIFALACALAAISLAPARAVAQPMMVDPSRMSGIPRPDPQVPAHTITVRLIRGELSNRVTGHDVELKDQASGETVTAKTDENGRATFSGLNGGPYLARASDKDQELVSQPIELPPEVGVRVMLVFSTGGPGAADGVGRPDKSVPPGTVLVRVVGDGGAPLADLQVVLAEGRSGEQGVQQRSSKTDDKGEARFTGLDAKPTSGYAVAAIKDGSRFPSKPFRLVENMGTLVTLEVHAVSKDLSQLSIGPGSHFILEITDDAVQVIEVLRLQNSGTTAVDPGPGGLHLPLPAKALSSQPGPQSSPMLAVQGTEAIWRGPIPPGDTQVQIMYVLAFQGTELLFQKTTPLPFAETALVHEKIDGFSVEAPGLQSEDRELQGRKLVVYHGPGTPAGGEIKFGFEGLPHSDPTWRLLAAFVALGTVIGFGAWALRGPPESGQKARLEQRREHLLEELAALDARGDAHDGKLRRKREELAEKLAQVYRELDEVQA